MKLAIVIPTIPGREESLARAVESYEQTAELPFAIEVVRGASSCGEGWILGVERFCATYGEPDFVHLTNDDCEVRNPYWWAEAVQTCGAGKIPAPVVWNPGGSLQSAGGRVGAAGDLLTEMGEDGCEVGFTTVPFISWRQWEQIGMKPVHYASDVWVSHRGRQLGIPTVLRHGYEIVHHTEQVGRNQGRGAADKQAVLDALAQSE